MQYPESSQRTRIEDETNDSANSNTPSSEETVHNGSRKQDTLKRETPKPNPQKPRVSTFLATVLLDYPPPEKPPASPASPASPGPPAQRCLEQLSPIEPPSPRSRGNYELAPISSRSEYDGYRLPSLSTDVHWGSPTSSYSDPGYDYDRLSDYSDSSASHRLPPSVGRRRSYSRPEYYSDNERRHRSSTGSIDSLNSLGSSEAEKSDAPPPPPAKPKKKSKMHQCEICGKWFPRPSGLRTHINTHTKARPYVCWVPGCNKSFAARSNAKRHLLTHGIDTSSKGKGNSYLLDFTTPTVNVVQSPTQSSDERRWSGNLRWMSPESATTDIGGSPRAPWLLV